MSNNELKTVGEMCDEIKSLKAENKSLKERFDAESSDEETSEEFERGYETCKNDMFDQYDDAVDPLKAEIKSLKAENKKVKALKAENKTLKEEKKTDDRCFWELNEEAEELKEQAEDAFQAMAEAMCGEGEDAENADNLAGWGDHPKMIAKIKSLKQAVNEAYDIYPVDAMREIDELKLKIKYYQFYLHTMDESAKFDLSKEDVDKFTDDEKLREYLYGEIGYEEDKYEDDDDWDMSAGFIVKDGEYRINMSGGHEGWYDYVMTKHGCFIHNKGGMKKVFTFVSCPEGNYIKVWDTPHTDGGLSLAEGETDMYQMVKECFQGEIMDYEEEEVEIEETHEAEVKTKKKKKKEKKEKTKK